MAPEPIGFQKLFLATQFAQMLFLGKDPIKGVAKSCEEQIVSVASTQVVSHPNYGTLWNHQQIQLNSALGLLTNKNPQKKF